jgi:hypothetical protein
MLRSCRAVCLAAVLAMLPAVVSAQNRLTMWVGLGYASTEGNVTLGKSAKQLGVQVGLPIIPVAVRGDLLLFGGKYHPDALAYVANAVLQMRLRVIQPYAILGRGRYATSLTKRTTGLNYGAGVRLGLGRFGIFAEMRRHEPIGRSVTMAGVTF